MSMQIFALIAMLLASAIGMVNESFAQGKPVETGSHWPVGLIFAGVVVLGIVLAYGIARNRSRTRAEKQVSEDVTAKRYRNNTTTAE